MLRHVIDGEVTLHEENPQRSGGNRQAQQAADRGVARADEQLAAIPPTAKQVRENRVDAQEQPEPQGKLSEFRHVYFTFAWYFDSHRVIKVSAWNTPPDARRPSTTTSRSSTKLSGVTPLYCTGNSA